MVLLFVIIHSKVCIPGDLHPEAWWHLWCCPQSTKIVVQVDSATMPCWALLRRGNTYFFDDKDENIHPFRGTVHYTDIYWPYCLLDKEQTLKTRHSLFLWPRKINHRQVQHVERQSVMGSPCPYHVSGTCHAWDTWDFQAQASMPDRSHAVPEIHFSGGAMLVPWRILTWICNQKCTHTKIVWFMIDIRWNSWVNLIKFEQFKIFVVHVCQREFNVHFQVCAGLRRKRSRMTKEWVFARLWDFMIYCILCALYDWCTTDVQVCVCMRVFNTRRTDDYSILIYFYDFLWFCIVGNYSDLKWEQCELGLSMCFL